MNLILTIQVCLPFIAHCGRNQKIVLTDALDFDLMVDTLRKLKDGKHVEVWW